MDMFTAQTAWCNYRIKSVPIDAELNVWGEPEAPYNYRSILMGELWRQIRPTGAAGVLWLTNDIALDPSDIEAMRAAVTAAPGDVHTGMVKLWPISTGRDDWIWSHRGGSLGYPAATQDETAPVLYFSIDCVWTPARLLDLAYPAGQGWVWNTIDVHLSEIAHGASITAHTVRDCRPKHLHFSEEHDGQLIRSRAIGGPATEPTRP